MKSIGDEATPLSLPFSPGHLIPAGPFYESWWFWGTVGGAIVAGTALAVGLALSNQYPNSDLPPTGVR